MPLPRWLAEVFVRNRAAYRELEHLPARSAHQLAHAHGASGQRVAKPVFLAGCGRPVAVVLPASATLDLGKVRDVLGAPDLRLATEEEIDGWFKGFAPGCVPPVRIRSDQVLLMDRSLAHLGEVIFAAGSHESAVAMSFKAWYRMTRPGIGRFALDVTNGANHRPMILVVEDEPDTNHLLCQLLERHGFSCRGVEDGQAAINLARELRPNAILLDLMLPDMSGFEVYERLRYFGPMRLPPTVVVTALDDDVMRQRGRELGADAYVTKPFFPESLMRELDSVLADAHA
ncbi:MAG: response regulator [Planctomycetes bacterium]|nr:response regulator [Planctomycetota bacterium]